MKMFSGLLRIFISLTYVKMEKSDNESQSDFSQMSDSDTEPVVKLNVTEVEEEEAETEKIVEEVKPTKPKPSKKVRSQKQIEAFEKARLKRAENLAIKKQAKLAESYKAYKSAKKKTVVQDIAGNNVAVVKSKKAVQDVAGNILSVDSSSSDDEQLPPPKTKVTKKTPAKKPTKKPKKKIVYESTSSDDSESSEEEVIVKRKTRQRTADSEATQWKPPNGSRPKEDDVDLSYFNVV